MKLISIINKYIMIQKPLWSRGLQNQQGRYAKEATPPLYFGCLNYIKNNKVFYNLHSTIWCIQRTWKIYIIRQHEENGLNQDMGFELSNMKHFKQSRHMSKLQYLSSWRIWHSPYSLGFWAPSRKIKKGVYKSKEQAIIRLVKLG